jgi:hypothetical protein
MRQRTVSLLGILLLGVLVLSAAPRHRAPAQSGQVEELKVAIHEWAVPTKGGAST